MYFNVAQAVVFTPDVGGLVEFKVTGDQVQKIKDVIMQEFMAPRAEGVSSFLGLPPDFQLIIQPLSKSPMSRIDASMKHQESTIYLLFGTAAAREFIKNKCGVDV